MTIIKKQQSESQYYKSLAFFKTLTLFINFCDEDITRFTAAAHANAYQKGRMVYLEKERADFFYIICSGWLKLFRSTDEGDEINLAVLTKGSIAGESAIFEQGRYTSSAQMVEDGFILSIPLTLLQQELSTKNRLAFNMLTTMVEYRRRHELQLEQYLFYSAPQRIGCFLLGLCPKLEQKDGVELNLPYDKTLIASTLGMKGATFSRALNILREETGIHISGTNVTICSIKKLLKFVDGCYSQEKQRNH